MTKVTFTYDIDTGTLGDGQNFHPYISLALMADGECQIHVGETQFSNAPNNGDAIFFVSRVLQMREITVEQNDVRLTFEEFAHKLGVLIAQYEGTGMINTSEQLQEQIKDTMSDWPKWAFDASYDDEEEEEDHDDPMGLDDAFQHGGRDDENTDWL